MLRLVQIIIISFLSLPVLAAPSSQYWSLWDKSDPDSSKQIDHSVWQGILDDYLVSRSDGNLFKYSKVDNEAGKKLDGYLASMIAIDPRKFSKPEQKAYWINLYNALTVDLILEKYPIKSITKIGSWFSFGPWDQKITSVAGQALTLNDIEHRILRPLWKDKRIHYAVNCASLSCPDLADKAYTRANVEALLERQTERFIQQEKGISWIDGELVISRIYEWYGIDFGSKDDLQLHLRKYSTGKQKMRLQKYTGIPEYQYNWNLNEVK